MAAVLALLSTLVAATSSTSMFYVARQNPRGVRWRLFIICVLLGSLESPPSIMVTRNLWSARV